MKSGIYKIECLVTGDCYIGSAVRLSWRWSNHRSGLRAGTHSNTHLLRAWRKYGEASFRFVPLLRCAPTDLIFFEQRAIDTIKPRYNINPTAGSALGRKATAETRAKLSAAHKGRPMHPNLLAAITGAVFSVERRAKISAALTGKSRPKHTAEQRAARAEWQTGKRHTPESIAKMRTVQKGRTFSPESLARMAEAQKKRPPCSPETRTKLALAGRRPCSEETRRKISAANTGKPRPALSLEQRAMISAALKGRPKPPRSLEHAAKLSAALTGRSVGPFSVEHRARLSAVMKGRKPSVKTVLALAAWRATQKAV